LDGEAEEDEDEDEDEAEAEAEADADADEDAEDLVVGDKPKPNAFIGGGDGPMPGTPPAKKVSAPRRALRLRSWIA
jgi:hypothetical protein